MCWMVEELGFNSLQVQDSIFSIAFREALGPTRSLHSSGYGTSFSVGKVCLWSLPFHLNSASACVSRISLCCVLLNTMWLMNEILDSVMINAKFTTWRHTGILVKLHTFLTLAVIGGEWWVSCLDHFTFRERAHTAHCAGGWEGFRGECCCWN